MAQNQRNLEQRALQAFEQQNYASALVDYRQLLAKDQQNPEFNYCYGVCIFQVESHYAAAKYFDFAIGLKQIPDPLLYYYRAKIYQEQYFFEQAISAYEDYQRLSLNSKNPLDVSTQIAECRRALAEITAFIRLPLLSVASTRTPQFYKTFKFSPEDYTFYEAPEVHSKNNAKQGHVPVYAYKRGMKYRIFSSYGPKGTQLDLYVQKKDANNNWGIPAQVGGEINDPLANEVFGFYDASTQTLYFSSTSKSIGGYDLYKAAFDLSTNTASQIEKMPYPYSSPSDDFFYVCDALQNQAYFATSRQGLVGQYEIYTLQLDAPVRPNFIFAGNFSNELQPLSKALSLQFTDLYTNEVYGPFVSDATGAYAVALPLKGEFLLEIKVDGASKAYQTRFSIPQLKPQTALQQQVLYFSDELGKEQWQVRNQLIELDPATQIAGLSTLQLNVAKGELLQAKSSSLGAAVLAPTTLAANWGFGAQDTATFITQMTDTLLAAEVSLENQVRLMELLRQDFEQQLNAREQLLAKLSESLAAANSATERSELLEQLAAVEQALAFDQRWIQINQAANIPDLALLDTLRAINERHQALLLAGDSLVLLTGWTERREVIQQYLQIAAFDGASALEAAQRDDQLRLQNMIKEENLVKEQQQQLAQRIKKLQTDLALQSKKQQAQTQQTIASLQRDLSQVEVLSKQLAQARQAQAELAQVYDQAQRKASYLKAAENQALPQLNFESTYEELLAQYAQQEGLSTNLKSQLNASSSTNPISSENGNLSSTNPNSPENGNLGSNQESGNPEIVNSNLTSPENGNVSTTNPISSENGNLGANENQKIIEQKILRFEEQILAISALDSDQLPSILPKTERLGLSNKELDQLELDLTLPSSAGFSSQTNATTTLSSEVEIQGYVNYVAQRTAFEQTKNQLQQNQLAIRSLEEAYTPAAQEQLLQLLEAQEVLLTQLKSQKQTLIQVKDQALYETLLLENFRPQVTTTATATTATSSSILGAPSAVAFQIQERSNTTTPLPVGLPCPEGLVFRVQVGAFRKPVPAERFREFTQVDGQVLANGLTVYMAGYFSTSAEALQQQKLIRSLGYPDAFVVAYQNCSRLSLAQGRSLENSPFAAPGEGLYYTVQVGVYNRPLTNEAQLGLPELIEAKTAKGQFRYASGKFANLQDAKKRQQLAVNKGIKDAFIVAYYQGKRIDLAQAKLLAQSGIAFEQNFEQNKVQPLSLALQNQLLAIQIPQPQPLKVPDPVCRFEIKCTDCQAELSRYNRVGVFIFDPEKEIIVSALQKTSEWDVVQLMYLKEMRKKTPVMKGETQTIQLAPNGLEGALIDWLLRQQNGYELDKDQEGELQLRYILPTSN